MECRGVDAGVLLGGREVASMRETRRADV